MANNVIGLFENESVAESVVEELVTSGFDRGVIKRFRGNNDQLEDELRREGIPADEASYYVNGLNEGGALVSVRAEENETDSAVDIMNRYVSAGRDNPNTEGALAAEGTAPAATGVEEATASASYRSADTGWGGATEESGKGIDAGSADYDGVASGSGADSAPTEAQPRAGTQAETQATTTAFPIGREAYASYTRRQPATTGAEETATEDTPARSSMGFPVGREAYAAYAKPNRAATEAATESPDSWTESGTQATGYAVGREAYEAYSREKASKWNR